MANQCGNCLWWLPVSPTEGQCRAHPPTVAPGSSYNATWPFVRDIDWCGEWAAMGGPTPGTPILNSLSPASLPAGSTPASVDVYGAGFTSACFVNIDGAPRSTFFIDAGHLQYTARPDLEAGPGQVQVTVEDSNGTSNALTFSFT